MAKRTGMGCVAVVAMLVLVACQDWPQYMGNPSLTGAESGVTFVSPANVAQLTEAWTLPTGASSANPTPVVAGSQLFVATGDGRLVAGPTDGVTGCSGSPVVCQPLWTASIAGESGRAGTPAVANGVVYETFISAQTPTGTLAAFDANGVTNCAGSPKVCQPLWTANVVAFWGVNVAGGVVYVDDIPTKQVEAFDASGTTNCAGSPKVCQPLWTGPIGAIGVPSVANGRVYVASSIQYQGGVAVFDAAGSAGCSGSPKVCQPLWTAAVPSASNGSVDVSGGAGYVETESGTLVAFDANGTTNCAGSPTVCQPLWTAKLDLGGTLNTPAVAGGRVYAASTGGYGHAQRVRRRRCDELFGFPSWCAPRCGASRCRCTTSTAPPPSSSTVSSTRAAASTTPPACPAAAARRRRAHLCGSRARVPPPSTS